jgi:hypothetical protein
MKSITPLKSIKTDIVFSVLYHWSIKYNKILTSDAFINYWQANPFALVNEALFAGLNNKQSKDETAN